MKLIHALLTRTCWVYESDFIILTGNYGFINLILFFLFPCVFFLCVYVSVYFYQVSSITKTMTLVKEMIALDSKVPHHLEAPY